MSVVVRPLPKIPIIGEIPTGAINGTNVTFTTLNNFIPGTTRVYLNGMTLLRGSTFDYNEVGTGTIILALAPIAGDAIVLDYLGA